MTVMRAQTSNCHAGDGQCKTTCNNSGDEVFHSSCVKTDQTNVQNVGTNNGLKGEDRETSHVGKGQKIVNDDFDPEPGLYKETAIVYPELVFGSKAVLMCALGNFGLALSLPVAMATMFLDWQEAFQVSRAHTVAVQSTAVGILFGGAVIPGYLMSRFGARFTVLIGSFLASVGFFASCFATSMNSLIVTAGIMAGLGFSFIQLPSMPAATVALPKYGSIVVSLCTIGSALLSMAFPFLFRYLAEHFSWRGALAFMSGFCMQTAVMGLIMTSYIKTAPASHSNVLTNEADPLLEEKKPKDDNESNFEEVNQSQSDIKETNIASQKNKADIISFSIDIPQDCKLNVKQFSGIRTFRSVITRVKNSEWKFIFDPMYLIVLMEITACLGPIFSFTFVLMDYAKTKGFSDGSTGAFFLFLTFIMGLAGKMTMGPLNMIPRVHSVITFGVFGLIGSFGVIMLGSATEYTAIVGYLAILGFGLGGLVSIYPKSILDLKSVDMKTYPLALGLACTAEGLVDFLIPIFIGYTVDRVGSYEMILHLIGTIGMVASLIMLAIKSCSMYKKRRSRKLMSSAKIVQK